MKSRKKLLEYLKQINSVYPEQIKVPETVKGFCDETYGKHSHIYITTSSMAMRLQLEFLLKQQGFKVFPDYDPKGTRVDVEVSYFKGWHWDE